MVLGWVIGRRPRGNDQMAYRRSLAEQLQAAMAAVGMAHIDMSTPVDALSGGYQRRLALALQLVRLPSLLLMDEPLAGACVSRETTRLLKRQLAREKALTDALLGDTWPLGSVCIAYQ